MPDPLAECDIRVGPRQVCQDVDEKFRMNRRNAVLRKLASARKLGVRTAQCNRLLFYCSFLDPVRLDETGSRATAQGPCAPQERKGPRSPVRLKSAEASQT